MSEINIEKLKGSVEDVRLFNEENGYTVFELDADGELVTVAGITSGVQIGEEVEIDGEWIFHSKYGRQFKPHLIKQTLPSDAAGMLRYLSSGAIKGVKEATAVKIIEAFGTQAFYIIEKDPSRLTSIKGISPTKAKTIHREFVLQFAIREVLVGLTGLGLSSSEAIKAYNIFKDEACSIISKNPYAFCVEGGYSFDRAEEIASKLKKQPNFSFRGQAGIVHIIRHNLGNGHTCIPRKQILKPAMELLGCNEDNAEIVIDDAIEDKRIVSEMIDSKEFLFLPDIYNYEKAIAQRINVMLRFPPKTIEIFSSEVSAFELANQIDFDEKQSSAIEIAVNKGLLILTGGPGTGKTTTVKGIITLMKNRGLNVALTAPTGRAAQRMTELTGCEAKTIHRLLEVKFEDDDPTPKFEHNLKNPLEVDAVIVDELSMVDITLFSAFLDALPLGCRLIMVGDKDQLPPVGAGNVLSDLIKSNLVDVITLDKVYRQAMKSLIVTNAHTIVKGQMPVLDRNDAESNFFFVNEPSRYNAPRRIVDLVTRRIPAGYNFDPINNIQVLCPTKIGEIGTANLNKLLQDVINPRSEKKQELHYKGYTLREGDKVMQIKNNYDVPWFRTDEHSTGVFNGDIGTLTTIDMTNNIINVKFDDKEAMYSIESARELELAYAMTVHKSQGSEFDAVVIPVLDVPKKLCYRNLFYTAVTRAKKLLILVGTSGTIKAMVENDKKSRRYSALIHFLSVDND